MGRREQREVPPTEHRSEGTAGGAEAINRPVAFSADTSSALGAPAAAHLGWRCSGPAGAPTWRVPRPCLSGLATRPPAAGRRGGEACARSGACARARAHAFIQVLVNMCAKDRARGKRRCESAGGEGRFAMPVPSPPRLPALRTKLNHSFLFLSLKQLQTRYRRLAGLKTKIPGTHTLREGVLVLAGARKCLIGLRGVKLYSDTVPMYVRKDKVDLGVASS